MDMMRAQKESVGAETATFKEHKKTGLDKEAVIGQLSDVVETGNTQVQLVGKTEDGTKLTGDNEEIKFQVPMGALPGDVLGKAKVSYEKFAELSADGTIVSARLSEEEATRARGIFGRRRVTPGQ
jgi:hypothetical protein